MPSTHPSRRDILRGATLGAVAGLAGCGALGEEADPLPDATDGSADALRPETAVLVARRLRDPVLFRGCTLGCWGV